MTELEKKLKAKIPGEDTGIEIRHSFCAICSPSHHCGVDCYVKDGRLLKVEGTPEHPYSHGNLCTKGSSLRSYVYREDRVRTPLKRTGPRGQGTFEPISWEEAYRVIGEKLNRVKQTDSPHSVAFFSGHCKWYRPFLQRFAYSFGSVNFGTDDSTCSQARVIADLVTAGTTASPDLANTEVFLGWNFSGYYSEHLTVQAVQKLKDRGGKVIIIDQRYTPAAKNLADIFLHIEPGTDGALALGMAKIIIDQDWYDHDFVEKHTYGFEEYKALVQKYPLDKVCRITGLRAEDIWEATKLYATSGAAATNYSASALVHRINGFQTQRAIYCLCALTGNFDRAGGNYPRPQSFVHKAAGFTTREWEFRLERRPKGVQRIGEGRFPLWDQYNKAGEYQAMTLLRQMAEGKPYPVKALVGFGLNAKMFPQTDKFLEALNQLDFFVEVDPFFTMTAKYADIVLPACTSLERSELKAYEGGYLFYTKPAIPPLYESKSDAEILCELAAAMDLDDAMLKAGYEACLDWIIDGCGLTIEELKKHDLPVKVPDARPIVPGAYMAKGFATKTGKFEFYSTAIADIDPRYGLNPLPDYTDQHADENDPETAAAFPFNLCTGARLPFAIHSRLHEVPWLRSLRPVPTCEINTEDAARLGIADGDTVELASPYGRIRVKAKRTCKTKPGTIQMLHGYTEANVNLLIGQDHLDPYSGFPGYKGMRCSVQRCP